METTHNPSSHEQTIAFIGGGQMASALIKGLLRSGKTANSIMVLEPSAPQRERLAATMGVQTLVFADERLSQAGTVVWAVKPQILQAAMAPVLPFVSTALHLSIAAGIASTTLARWLSSERVVRVMPNTPAIIGAGVTGMMAMPDATAADRKLAESVFAATGYCFWVETDERIDAVTAISGSGPGYVFYFLDSFQRAARMLGFTDAQARELVVQTTLGTAQQAASESTELATLRDRVSSKGGTTEAGLTALSQHQLPIALELAATRAYERARELSTVLDEGGT